MGVIMHNNILYGGGSTIEPNPQESATEQLETLGIDGDVYEVTDANAIHTSDVGSANGVAELDSNGKVPKAELPSDVVYDNPTFTEASTRANIASGDTLSTMLGKIKKWFSDLKDLAFIGKDGTSSTKYLRGDGTWQNFPTIPTVNDATLTIQKNGTAVETFTANSSTNKTANITVPTKTSDLTNDNGFVESSDLATVATSGSYNDLSNKPTIPAAQIQSNWTQTTTTALDYIKNKPTLATVATSGSYNDLSNKPTIPTVNNGTLTIQKNGTQVQTFTANQSSNATANITVPTKVSELTNDSGYTTNTGTVTQVKVGTTAYNPSSGVISLPAYPSDTNTHRPIQMNGTEILGNNTTALNLKAGSNVTLTNSSGTVTITATDTNTDTKNTAGTTNTTSKIFLAGATSQAANPQTYSNQYCYANGNYLYSGGNRVATLNGTEDLTNKTYNGYALADACAKAVQNSGSATALTASSLPTGQTITAYIKNNFMKALWEGTVNSAKTQNYTTSAGDNTRFVLVKYDVTNAGVLYQLMVVGEATCLNLFAKGNANYPITVYQRDISVSKTSFTTGAGHYCRYNTYGSGEYLRILGIYALFYGA